MARKVIKGGRLKGLNVENPFVSSAFSAIMGLHGPFSLFLFDNFPGLMPQYYP